MGTWNSTCLLTNLAIEEGDPVIGFLIRPAASAMVAQVSHHPTDRAHLATPLFHGKYDGYGSIFGIPRDAISNHVAAYHAASDIHTLMSAAERGQAQGLALVLMHAEAFVRMKDWMVKNTKLVKQVTAYLAAESRTARILRELESLKARLNALPKPAKRRKSKAYTKQEQEEITDISDKMLVLTKASFEAFRSPVIAAHQCPDRLAVCAGITLGASPVTLNSLVDVEVLLHSLQACRITLGVQTGAGSQSLGTRLQQVRLHAAMRILKRQPKE